MASEVFLYPWERAKLISPTEILRDDALLEQVEIVPLGGAVVLSLRSPEEPEIHLKYFY